MLLVKRRVEESVMVGGTKVIIQQVRGGRVLLGFEGPDKVVRTELLSFSQEKEGTKQDETQLPRM